MLSQSEALGGWLDYSCAQPVCAEVPVLAVAPGPWSQSYVQHVVCLAPPPHVVSHPSQPCDHCYCSAP